MMTIKIIQRLFTPHTFATMMDPVGKSGCKFFNFIFPVEYQGSRTNDQCTQLTILFFVMMQEGKGLNGFTQTHIIGEYPSPVYFVQIVEPVESMNLVRPEDMGQVRWRIEFL